MQLTSQSVALSKESRGVVVRPSSSSSSAPQALAFFDDEIRELQETSAGGTTGAAGKTFCLSAQPLAVAGELRKASFFVYDPTSDCVFFIDGTTTIKRLDRSNAVSLVAGREGEKGNVDGHGEAARLKIAWSLAADGKGNIFVADNSNCIRVLDVRTGGVRTLQSSEPVSGTWNSISYDAAADVLVSATLTAVCHIPVLNQCSSGGGASSSATPRLLAGSWSEKGIVDGSGTAARFSCATSVLSCTGGTILIGDYDKLRRMDASGAVTTVTGYSGFMRQLALLPGGELACTDYFGKRLRIISGGGSLFTSSSEVLAGRIPEHSTGGPTEGSLVAAASQDLLDFLLTPPGAEGGNTSVVTATISTGDDGAGGGGKSFTAHRSVLTARNEYFKTRLAADSGFVDSGATEVSLPEAHPEAFGRLLVYMYGNTLVVPDELLRPAAELARRLLLPADCISQLQARLMAAVTPESVVSDLVWAAQYGMDELVPGLKAYLLRHRKEVAGVGAREGLSALVVTHPDLATELLLLLLLLL